MSSFNKSTKRGGSLDLAHLRTAITEYLVISATEIQDLLITLFMPSGKFSLLNILAKEMYERYISSIKENGNGI